jgi:hypothetical protein
MKQKPLVIPLLLILLAACQSIGVPNPETFNERLAVGYSSVTAVRQTATTLIVAGKISAGDAENIQAQCDNARVGLDVARTLKDTDLTAANARLQAALTIVTALDSYLRARQ